MLLPPLHSCNSLHLKGLPMCYKQLFSLVNLQHCKRKHRLHEKINTVYYSKLEQGQNLDPRSNENNNSNHYSCIKKVICRKADHTTLSADQLNIIAPGCCSPTEHISTVLLVHYYSQLCWNKRLTLMTFIENMPLPDKAIPKSKLITASNSHHNSGKC